MNRLSVFEVVELLGLSSTLALAIPKQFWCKKRIDLHKTLCINFKLYYLPISLGETLEGNLVSVLGSN